MMMELDLNSWMEQANPVTPGTLYICGTPIGNLEDVSIRLLKTLNGVDLIACEDTRHTVKLLNRYGIKKRLVSYHEYSSPERDEQLLTLLTAGKSVALVSDAGMPVISDPGSRLIARANERRVPVEVVPGPSACIAALALSGLPGNPFIFMGFAPEKSHARKAFFAGLKEETRTVIFYEAPHRLRSSLNDLREALGDNRPVTTAKELTKKFQEIRSGTAQELCAYYTEHEPRGEFCVVVGGYKPQSGEKALAEIVRETEELIASGMPKKEAIRQQAKAYGIPKSELYKCFFTDK